MKLHFKPEEYDFRVDKVRKSMSNEGLDGIIMFRQESMYYLSGYDTSGYTMFQAMFLHADGRIALLIRSADRIQAQRSHGVQEIRIWKDRDGASPADELRQLLDDYGCRGARIGIEYHSYGLTAQRGKMVDSALEGFCEVVDASDTVRLARLVKSEAELEYVRTSGKLCDEAWDVACDMTKPGAFMGDIYGEMNKAILRGDGDPSASLWPIGAGDEAMFIRYHTGQSTIGKNDQVQYEFGASYRHYHVASMNMILTGKPTDHQRKMFDTCLEALDETGAVMRAGRTVGDIYAAYANACERNGFGHAMLNACGYTMGISYPPSWMDWPMMWAGNPQVLEENMVFFRHMILLDDREGCAMSLGETVIIGKDRPENVTNAPRTLTFLQ